MSSRSTSTSTMRRALADDMVIITTVIDSMTRLMRMFMQYMSRLVRSPVVSRSCTIRCEPTQLMSSRHPHTVVWMIGSTAASTSSALRKMS